MIEHVLPGDIEKRSMEIIGEELAARGITLDPEQDPVIRRAIHTSADFDYAETLTFSEGAVGKARDLIRAGALIVTDTNMALTGINNQHGSDRDQQEEDRGVRRRGQVLYGGRGCGARS